MTQRNRMKRQWIDFNTGSSALVMAPATTIRVLLRSVVTPDLGRELTNYTVVRTVFNLYLRTTSGVATVAAGLIALNQNIGLGAMGPISDPHSDWFWREHFIVGTQAFSELIAIRRDIASKRRETGLEREMYLYVINRSVTQTVESFAGGRLLILQH